MSATTICPRCREHPLGPHRAICTHCVKTLRSGLAEIAVLAGEGGDLETLRTKATRYGSGLATGPVVGKTQPLPADLRFLERQGAGTRIAHDVRASLVAWCRLAHDLWPARIGPSHEAPCPHATCRYIRARRAPVADTVVAMADYLVRMADALALEDFAPELVRDVVRLEGRLKRLLDRPAERWYAGICGFVLEPERPHDETTCLCECHVTGGGCDIEGGCGPEYPTIAAIECPHPLWAIDDEPTVRCPTCGTVWGVDARRAALVREARDRVATVEMIVRIATTVADVQTDPRKLARRIRNWAHRGQIWPVGTRVVEGQTRPAYRVGDVLDRLDQDDRKRANRGGA